jgi:hypothetical protein
MPEALPMNQVPDIDKDAIQEDIRRTYEVV